jgi:eukaryotic-like serine/threonine-protein kinase
LFRTTDQRDSTMIGGALAVLTETQWRAFSTLLDQVLVLPVDERATWLTSLAMRDPDMASMVERSLAARESDAFANFLGGSLSIATEMAASAAMIGRRIGAYVIDAEIGRGGMGSVWRAHRVDGRFEGTVAIKFVHASWTGNAGEERFQQEGRVLGRLNHPNIARLLDAGVLDSSQPYLVLEYVEGAMIDSYCEARGLSLDARIRLFMSVLQAVSHAHANLIVHRDIKPGNVFVTHEGVVKLLDFGIAKLIDSETQTASLTQQSAVALTPQYAAPEQLLGQPISTATDVYALGLMLYLLVTGKHPVAESSGSSADLIQAVLTVDPPPASSVAGLPMIPARSLAGDLDNILHKAMKKSPVERYGSATAFADDLGRYLANEPVYARADTVAYRAAKFVRRHRIGTALAGITLIMLTASVVATSVQAHRASRAAQQAIAERARADSEARRALEQRDLALQGIAQAQDLTELTSYLLGEALPDDRRELTTQVLLRGAQMVRSLKDIPFARRAGMLELIGTDFENRRDYGHAFQLFSEAHAMAAEGSDAGVIASSACHLAQASVEQGQGATGASEIDKALAALPDERVYADPRVVCHLAKSLIFSLQGRPEQLEEVETAARSLSNLPVPNRELESEVLSLLTSGYQNAMRVPEALSAYARAEKLMQDMGGAHWRVALVHFSNQGMFFWKIGRPLDARSSLQRSQDIDRERGTKDVDDPVSLLLKSRIALQLGDTKSALAGYAHTIKHARELGDVPVESAAIGEQLPALVAGGAFARAAASLPAAERLLRTRYPPKHWIFGVLRMQSALLAEHREDPVQARRLADEAIALFEANSTSSYQFPIMLVQRARIEQRAGRGDAARADAERAIAIYDSTFGKETRSASVGDAWSVAALVFKSEGNAAAARERFALAATHYESSLGPEHAKTLWARQQLQ